MSNLQLRKSNHAKSMDHYVATIRKHEPKLSRSYILERWNKNNEDRKCYTMKSVTCDDWRQWNTEYQSASGSFTCLFFRITTIIKIFCNPMWKCSQYIKSSKLLEQMTEVVRKKIDSLASVSCFNTDSNFTHNYVSWAHGISVPKLYVANDSHLRSPAHKNHHITYSKYIKINKLHTWTNEKSY